MIELNQLVAGLIGALLAGFGKIIADWRNKSQAREAYLSSIQAEVKCITDLILSQKLEEWLISIIGDCRIGANPKRRPGFDFGYNYFSVFDSLGGELKFLKKNECEAVVSFYMLVKAAFDTVKLEGPMQREQDLQALSQLSTFMLSILMQIISQSRRIESFTARRKSRRISLTRFFPSQRVDLKS